MRGARLQTTPEDPLFGGVQTTEAQYRFMRWFTTSGAYKAYKQQIQNVKRSMIYDREFPPLTYDPHGIHPNLEEPHLSMQAARFGVWLDELEVFREERMRKNCLLMTFEEQ